MLKIKTSLILFCTLFLYAESYAQLPEGQTPGGKSWADSYQANGLCWCDTTFDHDLDDISKVSFTINGVERNIRDVCDELQYHPLVRDYVEGDPIYNDIQCGNGPANTAIDEVQCPGRVDLGRDGCSEIGPKWDIEWLESRERFGGTTSENCDDLNAFITIQAEDFCQQSGIQTGTTNSIVGWVNNGDWVKYEDINFDNGANSFSASVSSDGNGGSIQIRLGSTTGTLLGTLAVVNTGSWETFKTNQVDISSVSGEQDIYLVFSGGSGYLLDIDWFKFENNDTTHIADFTPDPNKKYYIDSAYHNVRLAATGESEDAYTTSLSTTGSNVEWVFVNKGNGSWHIELAAGGSLPRLCTDNSSNADMQASGWSGTYTYYTISTGDISNSYYLTLTDGPVAYNRLQINNNQNVKMVPSANHAGTWESFIISEAGTNTQNPVANFSKLEAEDYDNMSGIQTEVSSEGTDNVGWVNNTDWIKFDDIDLTGAQSFDARVACAYIGGDIEVRLGSPTGTLLGMASVVNTGGNQVYETISANLSTVSGVYDVYFVFTGGNGYLFNVNWLEFSATSRSSKDIQGANGVVVSAYPNPVVNNLTIENAIGGTLEAYDILGDLVFSSDIDANKDQFNVAGLSTGVYYFRVKHNDELTVLKVIKK